MLTSMVPLVSRILANGRAFSPISKNLSLPSASMATAAMVSQGPRGFCGGAGSGFRSGSAPTGLNRPSPNCESSAIAGHCNSLPALPLLTHCVALGMTFQVSAGGEKPTTRRRLVEGWSWTLRREGTSTRTMRALMAGLLVGGISVACSPLPQRTFDGSMDEGESGEGGTGGEPMGRSEGGGKPSLAGAGSSGGAAGTTGTPTCAEDEYDDGASCQKLTICARGELVSSQPSKTADRACRACSAGTFSDALNAASCKAWKTCTSSQTQTMPGSATSDVVCVDKPACSSAKERTCTTQCPCASAEGVCTASNQCVSGSTCVAGSGKKVGRAGDTCLATHCNNDTLDSGETSVDCGGECGCRATFEIVSYKNIPSGATITSFPA